MGGKNKKKGIEPAVPAEPDIYPEDLKFTENEINNQCVELSSSKVEDIIKLANGMLDVLRANSCLKVRLTDFKVPQMNNKVVEEILSCEHEGKVQGKLIKVGMYKITRLIKGVYSIDKSSPEESLTIREFVRLNEKGLVLTGCKNGIEAMEEFANKCRRATRKKPIVLYYASSYEKIDLGDEEDGGFKIDEMPTPIREIFGKIDGCSEGVIFYIAPCGAPFAIHVDDLEANALNLVLYGVSKNWLMVNRDCKDDLRMILKHALITAGELTSNDSFANCRLEHHDIFIDPQFLRDHGIRFKVVEQMPGDLIIVGRSVFHQGINFAREGDVTLAVATNILLDDYLNEYEGFRNKIFPCGHKTGGIKLKKSDEVQIMAKIIAYRNQRQAGLIKNLTESTSIIRRRLDKLEAPTLSNRSKRIKLIPGSVDDHEVVGVVCPVASCDSAPFTTRQNMVQHYQRHFEDQRSKFPCNQCDKVFQYSSGRTLHITAVHQRIRFPCTLCEKSYTAAASLKRHMEKHDDAAQQANASIDKIVDA